MMRVTESLFPCYVFVKCVLEDKADEIRYVNGVSSLVNFGRQIPAVPGSVVAELVENFSEGEPLDVKDGLRAGDEVVVGCGAFAGMRASVVRLMPARQRVEVLLEMLGRPTVVEVDRWSVVAERESIAGMAPFLTAPGAAWMRA
jgi:transcriptional antiterminator RfaH